MSLRFSSEPQLVEILGYSKRCLPLVVTLLVMLAHHFAQAEEHYSLTITTQGKGSWGSASVMNSGYVCIGTNAVTIAVTNSHARIDSEDDRAVVKIPPFIAKVSVSSGRTERVAISLKFLDGNQDNRVRGNAYFLAYNVFENMIYPFVFSHGAIRDTAAPANTNHLALFKVARPAEVEMVDLGVFRPSEMNASSEQPAITVLPMFGDGGTVRLLVGATSFNSGVWDTHVREFIDDERLPRRCLTMTVSSKPDSAIKMTSLFMAAQSFADVYSFNRREIVLDVVTKELRGGGAVRKP